MPPPVAYTPPAASAEPTGWRNRAKGIGMPLWCTAPDNWSTERFVLGRSVQSRRSQTCARADNIQCLLHASSDIRIDSMNHDLASPARPTAANPSAARCGRSTDLTFRSQRDPNCVLAGRSTDLKCRYAPVKQESLTTSSSYSHSWPDAMRVEMRSKGRSPFQKECCYARRDHETSRGITTRTECGCPTTTA